VNNFRGWHADEDGFVMFLAYGRGSGYATYPYLRRSTWFGGLVARLTDNDPVFALDYNRGVMFIEFNVFDGFDFSMDGDDYMPTFRLTEFERKAGVVANWNW
jgi:hypothetical protein